MITMQVQYEDLNGDVKTADLYFHLYKHQALELLEGEGGLKQQLQNLITTEDGGVAYQAFKALIKASYGLKTDDGRFEHNMAATMRFLNGPELDALIDMLEANEKTALDFIVGIFPKGMLTDAQIQEAISARKQTVAVPGTDLYVPPMSELRFPAEGMTKDIRPLTDEEIAASRVPAAFQRPPADQARDENRISDLFKTYTREEILAAYDEQMSGKRPGSPPDPPAPPAA